MALRHALYLAPFDDLADPWAVQRLGTAAEANGWDGLFLWDHVYRPEEQTTDIADVWIVLAAVAAATATIRIGPMVTPVTRRRIATLARQTVTLDRLSGGRLTLGLGLGVDSGRELSAFGEIIDPRVRAARLGEGAELLVRLWSGERVDHRGEHFRAEGVRFRPVPVQQPRIPLWFAARADALAPVRRAARYDGLFPIEMNLDQFRRAVDTIVAVRGHLDGFDMAVRADPGLDLAAFAAAGATWVMHAFPPSVRYAAVEAYVAAGPPR
jgi:alkanesulfonate monooxygenase SsuD/methylene tetrahydromethanopterin reductase-like flavin-dependent oxidoreductase (luciferase family)